MLKTQLILLIVIVFSVAKIISNNLKASKMDGLDIFEVLRLHRQNDAFAILAISCILLGALITITEYFHHLD